MTQANNQDFEKERREKYYRAYYFSKKTIESIEEGRTTESQVFCTYNKNTHKLSIYSNNRTLRPYIIHIYDLDDRTFLEKESKEGLSFYLSTKKFKELDKRNAIKSFFSQDKPWLVFMQEK